MGWRKGSMPEHARDQSLERGTVWEVDWEGKAQVVGNEHPTQKPVELFARPMRRHTKVNDVRYEPFSGSGSQLIAAEQLNRRCYAMELDWQEMAGSTGHDDDAPQPNDGLTAKQTKAGEALLNEPTVARAAGVGERTLWRRLREPRFHDALLRARREAFGQVLGLMQRYGVSAAAALVKVFGDPAAPHSSRVSAAALVLKFGREGIELDDLAQRVERLERSSPTPAKSSMSVEGDERPWSAASRTLSRGPSSAASCCQRWSHSTSPPTC